MKKTKIQVTVSDQMHRDLKNVATLSGGSVAEVARGYIRDGLYTPSKRREDTSLRSRRTPSPSPAPVPADSPIPDRGTTLPNRFGGDPHAKIAKEAGLESYGAIIAFCNWAVSKRKRFDDWDEAFKAACYGWIKRARPDLVIDPESDRAAYYAKLKHPKWQETRLEVMKRAAFECQECGDKESQLHVHHTYYDFDLEPWDHPLDSLQCLCHKCHNEIHEADD